MTSTATHTGIRRYALAGLGLLAVVFGGMGGWAALARIDGAVIAPGVVHVESRRQTVQHLEGGIVRQVLVQDGERVAAGQVLVRLDDVKARSELGILRSRMWSLRTKRARLLAERDKRDRIDWGAAASADDPDVRAMMASQRESFEARQDSLDGEIELLLQRIGQLRAEADGLRAQRASKAQQIALLEEELVGLEELYSKGYAPKNRILALRREAERLTGERAQHASQIARSEKDVAETRIEILQLERTFRQEVVAELEKVAAQLYEVAERVIAARDQLRRLEVVAPLAGTVVDLRVHTVGGVVASGDPILDIVPDDDRFEVVARVAPSDIDKLAVGLPAVVRMSAFNMRTTPELTGHVRTVSADRLTDEPGGEPYYEARVSVVDDELAKLEGLHLLPGMPAEVFVRTGERSAMSYLAKPITDTLARTFRD